MVVELWGGREVGWYGGGGVVCGYSGRVVGCYGGIGIVGS